MRDERRYTRTFLLSKEERASWTALVRAQAAIVRDLEEEMRRAHGLSLSAYEVLAQLFLAPGHRLRMAELADSLVFTRSGVTRLVERLEREGLVERSDVDHDARGTYACLTDRGFDTFDTASDTHVDGLRRLFFGKLDRHELRQIRQAFERLLHERTPRIDASGVRSAARNG